MSGLNTEPAASLASPPQDDDVVGQVKFAPVGGDFQGEIEMDVYHNATFSDLKTKTGPNSFKPGEMKTDFVWLVTVDGQEDQGSLAFYTSQSSSTKGKLNVTDTCTAFGVAVPSEADPNIRKSAVVGKKCRVFVEEAEGKTSHKKYPKVTKVKARAAS